MSSRHAAAAVVALAVLLGGCSSSAEPAAEPEQSTEFTDRGALYDGCPLVFDGSEDTATIGEFWAADEVDDQDIVAADEAAERLGLLLLEVEDPIAPLLETFVTETTDVTDEALAGGSADMDPDVWVEAATELVELCEPYMADTEAEEELTEPEPTPTPTPKPKPKKKPKPTIPGDGVFEVGRDVKAGTYVSAGGKGADYYCVAFTSKNPDDLTTYIRGTTTKGQAIVEIRDGEYFSTKFCQVFKRR